MRKLIFLLAVIFLYSVGASAQTGVRFSSQIVQQGTVYTSSNVVTLPYSPTVSFCNAPASGAPCTNLATTYTDATLTTACPTTKQIVLDGTASCVASPDTQNNWGVWIPAGQYTYTVTIGNTVYGPYYVTAGGSGSGVALQTNGVANSVQDILNLKNGTNIAVTPDGAGGVTINSTAGAGAQLNADNIFTNNNRIKGPIPWIDFTSYMPAGGCSSNYLVASDPAATGSISSSSSTLTVSTALDFKNGCDVTVLGAGPTSTMSTPQGGCTISTVSESGSTVTVTCAANHNIIMRANGTGQGVVISGVGISGYNGTFTMLTATLNGTTFTYKDTTTGLSPSTGGTATLNWGYAHGATGSTTYNYQVVAVDSLGGVSAAGPTITITNGNATLSTNNYNWINYGAAVSDTTNLSYSLAPMYMVYGDGGLGGAMSCIGTSFTVGYADFGLPMPCPPFAPATPPVADQPQMLNATISSGGGTTTLTLGTAASNTVSSQKVYHDNTRFLNECFADFTAYQSSPGYIGINGCYIPAGYYGFNGQMPSDRTTSGTPTYTSVQGQHLIVAGALSFDTMPWIFNTPYWSVEGIGISDSSAGFVAYPSVRIQTGAHLPSLFVLEGGANGVDIEGFASMSLYGHGIWVGGSNPWPGGAPAGLRFNRMQLAETSTGGGAPVVFDSNVLGVWMNKLFLQPNPSGLDNILWTQTDYNDGSDVDFYISNVSSVSRGVKIDGPGGQNGGGPGNFHLTNWISESFVAYTTLPGFVEHDGVGAPGAGSVPLGNGMSIDNLDFSDALSSSALYSVFVENGTSPSFSNISLKDAGHAIGKLFQCGIAATTCVSNQPYGFPATTVNSPIGGNTGKFSGSYGGSISYNAPSYFHVGVIENHQLPLSQYGSGALHWTIDLPPLTGFTVASTGSGGLSAGTYYFEVTGLDNESSPGQTIPTTEISQTVGDSSSIVLNWTQANGVLSGAYGGFRLYFGTSSGGETKYCTVSSAYDTVSFTFTSTGCAGGSASPPSGSTAYSSWINAEHNYNSCLLCVNNATLMRLGINQPSPAEKLDVGGAINTSKYYRANETTAPTGASSQDFLWADSAAHRWKMNNNNGGAFNVPGVSSAGTSGHFAVFAANGIDLADGGSPSILSPTQINVSESTAPSGVSATDVIYGLAADHTLNVNLNAGGAQGIVTTDKSGAGGDCAVFATTTQIIDSGGPCGSGGTGTVTAFSSGDLAPLFTTSVATASTTPAQSFHIANIAGYTVLGNTSGSSGAIAAVSLSEAMLPSATVFTDTANTFGAHLNDFSSATWKWPAGAGATASSTDISVLDSTTGYLHGYQHGNDRIFVLSMNVGTSGQLCASNGDGTCTYAAAPSTFTPKTNGTNNLTTTSVNFSNTAGATGITFTNPSGDTESAVLASSSGGGNSVLLGTLTGLSAGDMICADSTPKLVNCTPGLPVNAQTGTTYTVLASDRDKLITFSNAASIAVSVPSAASLGSNFSFSFKVTGAGTVTFTPTTSTVNGASTLVALSGQQGTWGSDNTNYTATLSGFGVVAFGSLPSCSSALEGYEENINDSSSTTWGATATGSSSGHVKVRCNGTNWTVMGK